MESRIAYPRLGAVAACAAAISFGTAGESNGTSILGGDPFIDLGRGPVAIHVPLEYDPAYPAPLVLLLHGYTSSGQSAENYLLLSPLADEFGFLYLHPNGIKDQGGYRFWNATDACCDFDGSGVDDSGYLRALVDEIKTLYNVDERRVYFIGHSNGGFMSYRMACDHADTVAAVISFAGATYYDLDACTPPEPVNVLQIHGTADTAIKYDGDFLGGLPIPGAVMSVEHWANYDDCAVIGDPTPPPLDLDRNIPGDETLVTRYATDCQPSGSAELWTIVGGSHTPALSDDFSRLMIEYLLAHPKPSDCPADINADDIVDIVDLLAVIAAWGQGGVAADINEDGAVDVFDILDLLAVWGPCPIE